MAAAFARMQPLFVVYGSGLTCHSRGSRAAQVSVCAGYNRCMRLPQPRPVRFVGTSRRDLKEFPPVVRRNIGFALDEVQRGGKPANCKPLRGFEGASVLQISEDHDTDAYRAVYTVRFNEAVYVLHCFQKRSTRGAKTAKADLELIARRLQVAQAMHNSER